MDIVVLIWSASQPLLMIPCAMFVYFSFKQQRKFMRLKRELTRLQSITSSPIIGWCTAVLKACSEVRVLRKESYVRQIFRDLVDENSKNSLIIFGLDSWFEIRIAILNLVLVQIPSYGYVFYNLYTGGDEDFNIQKLIFFILGSTKLTLNMTSLLIFSS